MFSARMNAIIPTTTIEIRIATMWDRVILSRICCIATAEPVRVLFIAYAVTNERDITATLTAPTINRKVLSFCLKN